MNAPGPSVVIGTDAEPYTARDLYGAGQNDGEPVAGFAGFSKRLTRRVGPDLTKATEPLNLRQSRNSGTSWSPTSDH